ncbi:MAG TPA: hypothetical protein VFW23_13515, partial [Tepidisphaeraceae bacterium]|nr:hypothetical protein [Tepidisphaeraceae bacterium]
TPTNLILTRVVCGGDGNVYACGQVGTLIRGRKAKWELIQHGATENDFWGLAWFGGSLYVATSKALYRLEGNALTRVPIGPDIPGSYYHLKSAYGELWSIGPKDVMLFDGKNWTRID